jgi:hypothetical protein
MAMYAALFTANSSAQAPIYVIQFLAPTETQRSFRARIRLTVVMPGATEQICSQTLNGLHK